MKDVQIRTTIPADHGPLAEALIRVHALDGYPVEGVDDALSWVELPNALGQWTALVDGRPVGHAALMSPASGDAAPRLLAEDHGQPLDQIGVLAHLFVDPGARRLGVATHLLRIAEEFGDQAQLNLVLDVMNKDAGAIALYQHHGWELLGPIEHRPVHGLPVQGVALARRIR